MTVKRKANKSAPYQYDFEDIINRGGKTKEDSKVQENTEEVRFTLRIPKKLIENIDKDRANRVGNVSRNQWILEAIASQLD